MIKDAPGTPSQNSIRTAQRKVMDQWTCRLRGMPLDVQRAGKGGHLP
jgi:hypothetical protein